MVMLFVTLILRNGSSFSVRSAAAVVAYYSQGHIHPLLANGHCPTASLSMSRRILSPFRSYVLLSIDDVLLRICCGTAMTDTFPQTHTTTTTTVGSPSVTAVYFNINYVKSVPGWLKIIEIQDFVTVSRIQPQIVNLAEMIDLDQIGEYNPVKLLKTNLQDPTNEDPPQLQR
ncbi:unnamed protein product [Soboliphyme baturini]|uniref:Secreted protein n=1 Tax=Soboliphyme baturini TaxID=241478 RepID=A0A183IBX0_9BILA|nr:unnamed protein product [Soboliphyme baturini]